MPAQKASSRHGVTLTELVVAATLLVSTMAIVAPLTIRSGRLWQDTRHHQLAIDELSNQLERLTALDTQQREIALTRLVPSEHVQATLPGATLTAETTQDENGTRLSLSIDWNRRVKSVPLTLVGWIDAIPKNSNDSEGPAS